MKKLHGFYALLFLTLLVMVSSFNFNVQVVNAQTVSVNVNGKLLNFDQSPIVVNGTTLVPMRAIFTALGADVKWDAKTKTVTGSKDGTVIVLQIGQKTATKNGEIITLNEAATVIKGNTLVPIRFIADSLGSDVQWDGSTRTVIIKDTAFRIKEIKSLSEEEQISALYLAEQENNLKDIELLLSNISYSSTIKGNILIRAIADDYTDIIEYIVENKYVNLNEKVDRGGGYNTLPLVEAATEHKLFRTDASGKQVIVVHEFDKELIQYLVLAGAKPDPDTMRNAIVEGDIETVRFLLDHGADPNGRDTLNKTPLIYWANDWNREEIALLLIQYGANPTPITY